MVIRSSSKSPAGHGSLGQIGGQVAGGIVEGNRAGWYC